MKKPLALLLTFTMVFSLAACGRKAAPSATEAPVTQPSITEIPAGDPVTIQVAAVETSYGTQVWAEIAAAFEAETGIHVDLTTDKNLEDLLTGPMLKGEFPDVVHLPFGRPAGLTEQLVKIHALHDLTNTLSLTIPGETVRVCDKIAGGFTENALTAPYGDGKPYLAPMFYSPCGLFYNARLFEERGWNVPATWDEMWALGDLAAAEGISLFTYAAIDYYDTFLYALINAVGGPEFFNAVTTYREGAWDSENGRTLLSILDRLADYTHPSTPIHANSQDFIKNQLLVMRNEALFIPSGTWIADVMVGAEETLGNEFAWGMTAVPSAGTSSCSFCWFEQSWIPAAAKHIPEAERFVAFLYSDKAAEIFAAVDAVQPILGISEILGDEKAAFYSVYDTGARAAAGGFAPFAEIPGVTLYSTFFNPISALVEGTITIEEYARLVRANSAQMAAARLE